MAYRGRLIQPMLAEILRLDRAGTHADPDGAGPLTSGYDPINREPVLLASGDGLGVSARKELSVVKVPVQIEPQEFHKYFAALNGDIASGRMVLVAHFIDLETDGLVDGTGEPLLTKGDRLSAVRRMDDTLVMSVTNPPGLFITELLPIFGMGGYRNLLQMTFSSRDVGK